MITLGKHELYIVCTRKGGSDICKDLRIIFADPWQVIRIVVARRKDLDDDGEQHANNTKCQYWTVLSRFEEIYQESHGG